MALNTNGAENKRTGKSSDDDGLSTSDKEDRHGVSDAMDTDAIKQQIAPGLRSMYANVLNEDMPEDLLAMVEELAGQDEGDEMSSDDAVQAHENHEKDAGDD